LEGLLVAWQQFFDMLGFDVDQPIADSLPAGRRAPGAGDCLTQKLQKLFQSMVRRRCRIERLHLEIRRLEGRLHRLSCGAEVRAAARRRLARLRRLVTAHETIYQLQLARRARIRQRLDSAGRPHAVSGHRDLLR
jgi:hypothetical protein